jgi:hypothetical protein
MSALGQHLLDRAAITETQLEQAVALQQQLGGRLGTCLLELGLLTEPLLLQALSEQLGVPAATESDLSSIPPEALAVLPKKTAIRSRAVPFAVSRNSVDIAMLDVGDLTLEDELSFVAGRKVRFHVTTELRLAEALAKYYGSDISLRLASLGQQLSHRRVSKRHAQHRTQVSVRSTSKSAYSKGFARTVIRHPASSGKREAPASIPLTAQERASLLEVRKRDRKSLSATSAHEAFTRDLVRAETSSDVGQALLGELAHHFVRILLFRVSGSRQEVTGWLAEGPEVDFEWFDHYSVGLRQSSIFRQLLSTRRAFIGRLDPHPGHLALARCWGGSLDYECLLFPVFVRGRLVCVAYGDRASLGLADMDLSHIEGLARKAALAFERCILRRKLQSA